MLRPVKDLISKSIHNVVAKFNNFKFFRDEDQLPLNPKISYCTTCMGRLGHFKKTILQNLEDNNDYPNTEFVILNYNSPDHLEDWVRDNLSKEILSGKVQYYKTEDPAHFHIAHAKNIAHKLSTGDIVCNLDADNYTGKGFSSYLAESFCDNSHRFIHGNHVIVRGSHGRIAVLRKYFMIVGGYDEGMSGWGGEDDDIGLRLAMLGLEPSPIIDRRFLEVIQHADEERVKYFPEEFKDVQLARIINLKRATISWKSFKFRANSDQSWGFARLKKNFGSNIFEI